MNYIHLKKICSSIAKRIYHNVYKLQFVEFYDKYTLANKINLYLSELQDCILLDRTKRLRYKYSFLLSNKFAQKNNKYLYYFNATLLI
jgi:hypothetical protein